jgi:hypothetical protein
MAFLHCHSCDWSQDDFWDFRIRRGRGYFSIKWLGLGWEYNPVSVFLSYVFGRKGYWWPRRIDFDDNCKRENGWKRRDPHSWYLIGQEFKSMRRKFKNMRWRTMEEFNKDKHAVCPNCGKQNFDVD